MAVDDRVAVLPRLEKSNVPTMPLPTLNEEWEKRAARQHALFEEGGENIAITAEQAEEIRSLNTELEWIVEARDQKSELIAMRQKTIADREKMMAPIQSAPFPSAPAGPQVAVVRKSLGELVAESQQYKSRSSSRPTFSYDNDEVDFKALVSFPVESTRNGRVVPTVQRRLVVADLIPQTPTNQPAIIWMEETTFTNAAAPVAENAVKPESALAWTQRTTPVEVIGTWIPITNQQLDDVPQLQSLVNDRLTLMLELAEETQLMNGNGTSPQLVGFYNKAGIQTQAKGTDPTPDTFFKSMTKVRVTGGADPTAHIMHPTDWQNIKLLRTADGIYIWGSPAAPEGPDTLWGLPVVATTAATLGTGMTGDFRLYSHISRRMGVRIDVADQHSTDFTQNRLTIRIEERLSLEIYRAAAFCTSTGL